MLKIMIVDDMEIVRREIKRIKCWGEQTGFVIAEEAKDGYEALERLRCNAIDLIITDIKMPRIDGIELLKKVTEEKLCPCFIIMSDYSDFNYVRQGLVLGAFDYMVKPVDEEELKKLLERARDHIIERKNEQQRVKQLEQSLLEKSEHYFSSVDLEHFVELIRNKDESVLDYTSHIFDTISSNFNNDIVNIKQIINSIFNEIILRMQHNEKWLTKFVSSDKKETISFNGNEDLNEIKIRFINEIEVLMALVNKLFYRSNENQVVNQVCRYVLENIDRGISLKVVSDQIFMNKTYVSEVFKQKSGISFTEYITTVKMERAKKLMTEEKLKTYEIAELLGFKDIEYFSKLFKKNTGFSPTEYKQKVAKRKE